MNRGLGVGWHRVSRQRVNRGLGVGWHRVSRRRVNGVGSGMALG